jgi:DNA-binding MarR family transcriptional regulator
MLKKTEESVAYVNFLRLVNDVRVSHDFTMLSPIEERLLNLLASAWIQDQKITVLKAMQFDTEVSHSTSHRLLKGLRQKNLISLEIDERDNRIKYVMPTDKASDYFKALGSCLERAYDRVAA